MFNIVADAVDTATYVIIAVKPFDVEGLVGEIADAAAKAETDTAERFRDRRGRRDARFYENKLPAGSPVIRVMPNAPMVVGAGVSALARGRFATTEHLKEISAVFAAVGGVLRVPETQLDAVTAVSGSGPAYFFLMVEAMVDAGVEAAFRAPSRPILSRKQWPARPRCCWSGSMRRSRPATRPGFRRVPRSTPPPRSCANSYLARGHHRRWSAGTRKGRFAGSRGRGGRSRKNPL